MACSSQILSVHLKTLDNHRKQIVRIILMGYLLTGCHPEA